MKCFFDKYLGKISITHVLHELESEKDNFELIS